jgi:hypothetical protein
MYTKQERDMYNKDRDFTCERLGITKNQYNWFRRLSEQLRKTYEDNCNGDIAESEYTTKVSKAEVKITNRAKELGLYYFLQTDPRGATIYLSKEFVDDTNYISASCIY